jgi:hypothetical protein
MCLYSDLNLTTTGDSDTLSELEAGGLEMIDMEKCLFYDWRNSKGVQLRRGKAVIFHDKAHEDAALTLGHSFEELGYMTSYQNLGKINLFLRKFAGYYVRAWC